MNFFKTIERTTMLNRYLFNLILRIAVFLTVFIVYITNKTSLINLINTDIISTFNPLHILWGLFVIIMITHLFPNRTLSIAIRKSHKDNYKEKNNYNKNNLKQLVYSQNRRALVVMLVWIAINMFFGLLYKINIFDSADLFMLSILYFLCDYLCILFFCPFQTFIMKNRCCLNCRIYDWGHFMTFLPLIFIGNIYSITLFIMSLFILIRWEIIYSKHPQRFFDVSNSAITCASCKEKNCQMKKKINKLLPF